MKPVFKEELDFLNIDRKFEGYLWKDRMSFMSFNEDFELVKFGRKLEKLPKDTKGLIKHIEISDFHYYNVVEDKINYSKRIMRNYLKREEYKNYVISVSGGKDSTVMKVITSEVLDDLGIDYEYLFLNTSNETHQTYKYVKDNYKNLSIINPEIGFYNWCLEKEIIPSRTLRSCCATFKEGNLEKKRDKKIKELHFLGIRRNESATRKNYKMIQKGNYGKKNKWRMMLPIIEFDDIDVWSYLLSRGIEFNELYRYGYGRVGCAFCPYRTKYESKLNKEFLPTYTKKWESILKTVFIKTNISTVMNCTVEEFVDNGWKGGKIRDAATEEVIEEFAKLKGISYNKAKRKFDIKCDCGKPIRYDILALNEKLLGRTIEKKMCSKCLAEFLGTTQKKLKEDMLFFKNSGCTLF